MAAGETKRRIIEVNTLPIPMRAPEDDLPLPFRGFVIIPILLLALIAQQTCLAQEASPIAPKPATASESQKLAGWLQYIALELKKIRLELIEERCEKQQTGLSNLERELQLIRDQQREMEEEQNAEVREPVEIDSQLAQPGLSKEQREELEARKADLLSAGPSRFAGARSALAQREAQVRDRIAGEQQRIQQLARQAQALAPPPK
jgi:hypothetical protein